MYPHVKYSLLRIALIILGLWILYNIVTPWQDTEIEPWINGFSLLKKSIKKGDD